MSTDAHGIRAVTQLYYPLLTCTTYSLRREYELRINTVSCVCVLLYIYISKACICWICKFCWIQFQRVRTNVHCVKKNMYMMYSRAYVVIYIACLESLWVGIVWQEQARSTNQCCYKRCQEFIQIIFGSRWCWLLTLEFNFSSAILQFVESWRAGIE